MRACRYDFLDLALYEVKQIVVSDIKILVWVQFAWILKSLQPSFWLSPQFKYLNLKKF